MSTANKNSAGCLLSVVIISRNEEENIAKCLDSVLKATKEIENSEIILVDSASTDKTIEIAIKYPIKILQLRPHWRLSPSAGCYIGFLHSSGMYIQFLGGDMILDENWFGKALNALKEDEVAGVSGICTQEMHDTKTARRYADYHRNLPLGEVKYFSGGTLFKREVLSKVGSFNPYLCAGEEGELCYRVIAGGYKLLRLPYHMSHHLGAEETGWSAFKKRLRYTIAQGQIFRYSLDNKLIFKWRLEEYKFKLISAFLAIFGIISIGLFLYLNYVVLLYFWTAGVLLFFVWVLYDTRNVIYSIRHVITQTFKFPFFMLGFLEPKKNPKIYPADVKIIKS
jgi:glycosyltransferase involved in cell wall biosynthesis